VLLGLLNRVGKRVAKLEVQSEEANLLWAGFHAKDPQGEGVVPWLTFVQVLRDLGVGHVKRAEKTALLHRLRMDNAGIRARPNVSRTDVDYGSFVRLTRATMTGGDGADARDVICRLQTALANVANKSGLTLQDALQGASGRTGRVRLDQVRQVLENDFGVTMDDQEFKALVCNFCDDSSVDTLKTRDFVRYVTKPMLLLTDGDGSGLRSAGGLSAEQSGGGGMTNGLQGVTGSSASGNGGGVGNKRSGGKVTTTRASRAASKAARKTRQSVNKLMTKLVEVLDTAETRGMSLTDSFKHFDVDGKGEITHKQFATGLVDLGFTPGLGDLDCLTRRFDVHNNGSISRREFVERLQDLRLKHAFAKLRSELAQRKGTDLFREFSLQDSNDVGRVNLQTAKATLTALGLSQVHVESLVNHVLMQSETAAAEETKADSFVYGELVDQVKDMSMHRLTDEEGRGDDVSSSSDDDEDDEDDDEEDKEQDKGKIA
jgi:hypothetical protein